jgi:hypothetical protein
MPVTSSNSSIHDTYKIIGDNASALAVMDALKSDCGVNAASPTTFNSTAVNVTVHPEQIVQWYRTSSFALALDSYNNTAALVSNAPADNKTAPTAMSPAALPSGIDMTFLACLNATIAAALPLVEQKHKGLSTGAIAGIVVGSTCGALLIVGLLLWLLCRRRHRARRTRELAVDNDVVKEKFKPAKSFAQLFTRNKRGKYTSLEHPPNDTITQPSTHVGTTDPYLSVDSPEKRYMAESTTSVQTDTTYATHTPFPMPEPQHTR